MSQLTTLVEATGRRKLAAELMHRLKPESKQGKSGNLHKGISPKTVVTPTGKLNLEDPRGRQAM